MCAIFSLTSTISTTQLLDGPLGDAKERFEEMACSGKGYLVHLWVVGIDACQEVANVMVGRGKA
jgi:hypothetical protein